MDSTHTTRVLLGYAYIISQGLELEGFEQPAEGEQPTPSNIPWAHRARAGET